MSKYIYSTLSNDQNFTVWVGTENEKAIPTRKAVITINGKANIINKTNLITPKGVLTIVEDGQLAELEKMPAFKRFIERGFIKVEAKEAKTTDVVAKDMKEKDKSAPLDPASIKKAGKTVKTNAQ